MYSFTISLSILLLFYYCHCNSYHYQTVTVASIITAILTSTTAITITSSQVILMSNLHTLEKIYDGFNHFGITLLKVGKEEIGSFI